MIILLILFWGKLDGCGKLSYEFSLFVEDTCAYIPYAVIGIFILLAATFTSVYLLKIDSEVAETIYTTGNNDPRQSAINLASFDLARCLNYAGMEALEWQGEHPVILPEGNAVNRFSEDGFMVIPKNQNLEKEDTLQIWFTYSQANIIIKGRLRLTNIT